MEQRLPMLGDACTDRLIDRRNFLSRSVALAVISALADSCVAALPTAPELTGPLAVSLADYPTLTNVDGVARIQGTDVAIALVNLGGGEYLALSLVCPHQAGSISWRGDAFVCSVHGATFAEDGHWIGGQPTSSMRVYNTSYDSAAGTVTISP